MLAITQVLDTLAQVGNIALLAMPVVLAVAFLPSGTLR